MTQKDPEKFLALIDVDGIRSAWAKGDAQWHENEWKEFIKNIRKQTIEECVEMVGYENATHSVYTRCLSCGTWGICFPNDKVCGNCNSTETVEYWPNARQMLQQKLTSNE